MRRRLVCVLVASSASVLVACRPAADTRPVGIGPGFTAPATPLLPCEESTDPLKLGKDAHVTGATVCRLERHRSSTAGQGQVEVTYAVTSGLAELAAAYAEPDGHPGTGFCTTEGYLSMTVIFSTSSGPVPARQPTGVCGKPLARAIAAYFGAGLREVSQRPQSSG